MNARQRRFVSEYLRDHNATKAARRSGYSKKTAHVLGCRLLRNVKVATVIARLEARLLEKSEWTLERWLEECRRIGLANLQDFYDEDGNLKPIHELTRAQAAALAASETIIKNARAGDRKTDTVLKLRLWDKLRALEMVGKHFKWLDRLGESDAGDWEKLAERLASIRQEGPPKKP